MIRGDNSARRRQHHRSGAGSEPRRAIRLLQDRDHLASCRRPPCLRGPRDASSCRRRVVRLSPPRRAAGEEDPASQGITRRPGRAGCKVPVAREVVAAASARVSSPGVRQSRASPHPLCPGPLQPPFAGVAGSQTSQTFGGRVPRRRAASRMPRSSRSNAVATAAKAS